MKKVLLGTSAIALASAFATPADAVEWTVRVGGYAERHVVYADIDTDNLGTNPDDGADLDGIDVHPDTEVYILPSITLDNGLQFGANIQLEGDQEGVDESFIFVDGSFGTVNIGSENSAGYLMTYIAPAVGPVGVNSGSLPAFTDSAITGMDVGDDFNRMTLGSSTVETLGNSDIARLTYFTPRFAGFQAGVSYGRDDTERSGDRLDCDDEPCDFVDVAANYVNSFGDFNLAVSGRYGFVDAPSGGGTPEVWAAGLNLGYAGFTVGGSYAESDKDHDDMHGRFWDVGASYETGPWGFSFTYGNGENVNDECGLGGCGGNDEEELEQYLLAINYALAQGVNLSGFGGYLDFDEECACEDSDAWLVGTSVRLDF